jgi:hypothetical protein
MKKARSRDLAFRKTLVRLAGIEPTTPWFVAKYSIQLSYSRPMARIIAMFRHLAKSKIDCFKTMQPMKRLCSRYLGEPNAVAGVLRIVELPHGA